MMGKITSIALRGFRSLRSVSMTAVPELTVFVGGNGAGKSNFLEALKVLGQMQQGRLQAYLLENGGADNQLFMGSERTRTIEFELSMDGADFGECRYETTLEYCPVGGGLTLLREQWTIGSTFGEMSAFPSELESVLRLQKDEDAQALSRALSGIKVFDFSKSAEDCGAEENDRGLKEGSLSADGGNLAAVLLHILKTDLNRYRLIVYQIQRFIPDFLDFDLTKTDSLGKAVLQWQSYQSKKTFGVKQTSENSLRLFCLATLFNLPQDAMPSVLCVEEPERGLHPQALEWVVDCLKEAAMDRQVILTTQSSEFVDCFEARNVFMFESRGGETRLQALAETDWREAMEEDYRLSDVWLSRSLGGVV